MARVSNETNGIVSLARGIQCWPNLFLFILLDVPLYIAKYMCVYLYTYIHTYTHIYIYVYISACTEIYIIYRRYQTILRVEQIYTNRELCEVLT